MCIIVRIVIHLKRNIGFQDNKDHVINFECFAAFAKRITYPPKNKNKLVDDNVTLRIRNVCLYSLINFLSNFHVIFPNLS